jgi:HAD superfamily hydrolase (TIGR01509 family)
MDLRPSTAKKNKEIEMSMIETPKHIQGLIFDCDGTLVDSMPLHMKAWKHVITVQGGVWNYDFFFDKKGTPEERLVNLYNEHFGAALSPKETVRIKHEFFKANAMELAPIPEVVDVVERLRGKLPMAVASGGVLEIVEFELNALRIKKDFIVILTADDRIEPKPAPDIFLEAARRLGIAPEHCQVFEDGDLGLDAARSAGMLATDVRLHI